MSRLPPQLSYANGMATLAVFLAIGGSALALSRNSIKSRHIAPNAVKGVDADESTFGIVPQAQSAVTAQNAASAQTAGNAGLLDSIDSSGFLVDTVVNEVRQAAVVGSNEATAPCPAATQAVGGGAGFNLGDAADRVISTEPNVGGLRPQDGQSPDGWFVRMHNNALGGGEQFIVWAVCARGP
jgi:hypothetical protein